MDARSIASFAVAVLVLAAPVAEAQRAERPLVIPSMAGRDLYQFYCASCHGADAAGRGPVAAALKTPPANLTTIAQQNGGIFPRERITALVSSGTASPAVKAHGPNEMPVWGPIFNGLDTSDTRTKMRIENVVAYLESLQKK